VAVSVGLRAAGDFEHGFESDRQECFRPQEIADLVTFIASPCASYLSGVVIDADGGRIYDRG
jgi:NAD(P)-dependent dehydrogenase (short-subunit alcohol dehydrogenase family)